MKYGYKDKHSKKVIIINERGQKVDPRNNLLYHHNVNNEYWTEITNKNKFEILLNEYLNKQTTTTMEGTKLICLNNNNGKFRHLTPNKEYTLEAQEDDYYVVINDRNESARYAKKYFKISTDKEPAAKKERVLKVEQWDGYDLKVRVDSTEWILDLNYIDLRTLDCSCSITEFFGINPILEEINAKLKEITKDKKLTPKEIDLFKEPIEKAIEEMIKDVMDNNLNLFSTNVSNNKELDNLKKEFNIDFIEIMSKIVKENKNSQVFTYTNKNTSNEIMTWIIM
jgi:hypothetical protein